MNPVSVPTNGVGTVQLNTDFNEDQTKEFDDVIRWTTNIPGFLDEEGHVNNRINIYLEQDDELYGTFQSAIVGIQRYNQAVSYNEMVNLVREHSKELDSDVVKVENVEGKQIGYLERDVAKALARIMDKSLAKVEGFIPFLGNNRFHFPIDIRLRGASNKKRDVLSILEAYEVDLEQTGEPIKKPMSVMQGQEGPSCSSLNLEQTGEPIKKPMSVIQGQEGPSCSSLNYGGFVTSVEIENELDKIFETLEEEDKTTEKEPVTAIKTELYPHQKQAFNWMICKENKNALPPFWKQDKNLYINTLTNTTTTTRPESICGGILADDMGLGKTLEIIALILSNFVDEKPLTYPWPVRRRKNHEHLRQASKTYSEKNDLKAGKSKRAEKKSATSSTEEKGSPPVKQQKLKTSIGNNCTPLTETSPSEQQYLSSTKISVAGQACRDSEVIEVDDFSDDDCIVISDSDDELHDKASSSLKPTPITVVDIPSDCDEWGRSQTSGPRGTLIICPVGVISNWKIQFEEHVQETASIQIYIYHGPARSDNVEFLKDQDVVITSYSTVAFDFRKYKTDSPLHKIEWLRIVLDEGHEIRNPMTERHEAISKLKAQRRWVLTGTPIQNSLLDLYSLLMFLKVKPFITDVAFGQRDGLNRVADLMKNLAMRRKKNKKMNGRDIVELPGKKIVVEVIEMKEEERKKYDEIHCNGKITIERFIQSGITRQMLNHIFVILLRLRQMCCHPKLIPKAAFYQYLENETDIEALLIDLTQTDDNNPGTSNGIEEISEDEKKQLSDKLLVMLNSGSDEECPLCFQSLTRKAVITVCSHLFCRTCIEDYIEKKKDTDKSQNGLFITIGTVELQLPESSSTKPNPTCPICRKPLDKELIEVPPETMEDHMDDAEILTEQWETSAKTDALMKALIELRQSDTREKSVVVSEFTSFLSLIEIPLRIEGFKFARLDGKMTAKMREKAIREFSDPGPDSPTVFLLSLKAGGVGINLTAASRVFLMAHAWNPAAEEDCFDRCHRIGQTKDVVITKFVIHDSIEEKMLGVQDKKRNLMKRAFDKKPTDEERRQISISNLQDLMDL